MLLIGYRIILIVAFEGKILSNIHHGAPASSRQVDGRSIFGRE
jgi:hypothetical protein